MSAKTSKKKMHVTTPTKRPGYLRTRSKKLYVPNINKKGMFCEGDRFDYVVPWEISERKLSKKHIG